MGFGYLLYAMGCRKEGSWYVGLGKSMHRMSSNGYVACELFWNENDWIALCEYHLVITS